MGKFFSYLNLWGLRILELQLYIPRHTGRSQSQQFKPVHEISNNVVCATSKASDQPALMRSLTRAFASGLTILWLLSYWLNTIWSF